MEPLPNDPGFAPLAKAAHNPDYWKMDSHLLAAESKEDYEARVLREAPGMVNARNHYVEDEALRCAAQAVIERDKLLKRVKKLDKQIESLINVCWGMGGVIVAMALYILVPWAKVIAWLGVGR